MWLFQNSCEAPRSNRAKSEQLHRAGEAKAAEFEITQECSVQTLIAIVCQLDIRRQSARCVDRSESAFSAFRLFLHKIIRKTEIPGRLNSSNNKNTTI